MVIYGPPWLGLGLGYGEIADPASQPAWRDFKIRAVEFNGQAHAVVERRRILTPFVTLTHLDREGCKSVCKCLVVMAQSGHFSLILRDLVAGLLGEHDVAVLDWTNARHIPPDAGRLGFEDTIATIITALRKLGPGVHLVGVCQSAIPAIAAAIAMDQLNEPAKPASLTLIGAPVDPCANPTRVSSMLTTTPIASIEADAITVVPTGFPGAGREVFSAAAQQRGLLTYLGRHFWQFGSLMRKVIKDDGADTGNFPFLTLFTSLKDIPKETFIESIAAIYQDRLLWTDKFVWQGQTIDPDRVTQLPLMTIEADQDDIAAPGQTYAAHRLFQRLSDTQRGHFVLRHAGHFSLFHGAACRNEIVPAINRFLHAVPIPSQVHSTPPMLHSTL